MAWKEEKMKGKIIVIEGTDCSGKQTQAELLQQKLKALSIKCIKLNFPRYDTPTGRILGGPYLGKPSIGEGFFCEGASNVDPKVAALYFAADRYYNIKEINSYIDQGYIVILDRYVESNMAHQGGKLKNLVEREELWQFLETLEYKLLKLPKPDLTIFLHMPYTHAVELKKRRQEVPDQHELDPDHLKMAEEAYIQLKERLKWTYISCIDDNKVRTIEDINKDLMKRVLQNVGQ